MRKKVYLTSGQHIKRWLSSRDGLHSLGIFGIRGGYLGQLKYRDEDIEKIISTIKEIASDTPPKGPEG